MHVQSLAASQLVWIMESLSSLFKYIMEKLSPYISPLIFSVSPYLLLYTTTDLYPKGRGSRVYPNVGAVGYGLVGAGGVLGRCPRSSLYEFVLYNLYKKCTNCMNLYYTICIKCTNYMNLYYTICIKYVRIIRIRMYEFVQKLAKKKKKPGWDFNP